MIASQPETLRAVAQLDVSAAAERLRSVRRLFIVGTGTSHHAALLAAYLLRSGGIDAQAVPSAEMAGWRPSPSDKEGVVVISHTGETAYARSVRQAAQRSGVPLVTITGESAGWPEAIITPTRELSETYTVSYTAALGVLGLLAAELTGLASGAGALRQVAADVDRVLLNPELGHMPAPARALAFVGPGPWSVTAREGALKVREAAQILAEGFDPEALLHGAAVPYGPGDALIALSPADDPDGLTAAVAAAARETGAQVYELPELNNGPASRATSTPAQLFLRQISATVCLQVLADNLAAERGTNPDTAITGAWTNEELWNSGAPAGG